jgi:uncharacterized membrane protein YkvA (DUF1232 family)
MGIVSFAVKSYRFYKSADKEGITKVSLFNDVAALKRLVEAIVNGKYKTVKKRNFLKVALGFLYLFSAVDFVPDFIPFIGWVDDVAVLFIIYRSLKGEIERFKAWEQTQPKIIKAPKLKSKAKA